RDLRSFPTRRSSDLRAADGSHRARAIRFENVAHDAHGVGKGLLVWNDGGKRAFRQCAVADFTASGAAHKPNLTNAEGREVIVQRSEEHTSELQSRFD